MIDIGTIIAAGMDPKTGLPLKLGDSSDCELKNSIKRNLEIMDRQNAINRYTWTNLPKGLTPEIMERILYYKGQAMLFYMEADETFYFLPYALDGTIDVYGRYNGVTPLPFAGGTTTDEKEKPWIQGLVRKPLYDLPLEEITMDDITGKCVIFRDYSPGISQTIIPRSLLQNGILDVMSDLIPYMRTALSNATGTLGMRVNTQGEEQNVKNANASIRKAALNGEKYIPFIGNVDFQELAGGEVAKAEEFLLALQSIDNFRLSLYGLDNGGLFQKKSHMLEAEQEMNTGNVGLILQDGLALRQWGCLIANLLWGTEMWCEISETVIGIDKNLDGEVSDEQDGQYPADHPSNDNDNGGSEE